MMRGQSSILLIALVAVLLPWAAKSRVFQIVGNTRGRLNVVGLPWEEAYTTTMNVNGRKNDVVVYSANYSEPVAEQLKAQFELQGATVKIRKSPDGGAMGVAKWDGGEARILVLAPETPPNHLVFLFYPEAEASNKPKSPVPEYPRGRTTNTVFSEETKAFCKTLTTEDSVMQVQRFYVDALAREGWTPVLPMRLSGGMTYFHRKEQTCCVLASRHNNGATVVTVLVRDVGF